MKFIVMFWDMVDTAMIAARIRIVIILLVHITPKTAPFLFCATEWEEFFDFAHKEGWRVLLVIVPTQPLFSDIRLNIAILPPKRQLFAAVPEPEALMEQQKFRAVVSVLIYCHKW